VVGYSRLMGADESGTLAALRSHREELWRPKIAEHGGSIVGSAGDSLLVEFSSVVAAVRSAMEIQRAMVERSATASEDRRMLLRIGVHLGEVIAQDQTIYGDGVNIAARLQEVAEPGGICISNAVHDNVRHRVNTAFDDGGNCALKNIAEPVRVWRWSASAGSVQVVPPTFPILELPDKPSIAVLPFANVSGDPEQEYFTDGITEDIITELSRFRSLFVIARNSSFTFKGKAVDVRQVARDLGVRYVLEGSIRKAANRVRVTAQLIDATTGKHLWAERYDRVLEDIFELQDQLTASVVGALMPKLEHAEIDRSKRKPTASLGAYDYYLRGLASTYLWTEASYDDALAHFNRAIDLDPNFAAAHGMAARCYVTRMARGWMVDRANETDVATVLARRAQVLGSDDAVALMAAGHTLAHVTHDLDAGAVLIARALTVNPNLATTWAVSGWIHVWLGEFDTAQKHLDRAMRLSPLDPLVDVMRVASAHASFFAGNYDAAIGSANHVLQGYPDNPPALRIAAASYAFAGRPELAAQTRERLSLNDPRLRISNLKDVLGPYRRPADLAKYAEGLRRAGLPE
jgi:TolB-like protein